MAPVWGQRVEHNGGGMTDKQLAKIEKNMLAVGTPADISMAKMLIAELRRLQANAIAACCICRPVRVG